MREYFLQNFDNTDILLEDIMYWEPGMLHQIRIDLPGDSVILAPVVEQPWNGLFEPLLSKSLGTGACSPIENASRGWLKFIIQFLRETITVIRN